MHMTPEMAEQNAIDQLQQDADKLILEAAQRREALAAQIQAKEDEQRRAREEFESQPDAQGQNWQDQQDSESSQQSSQSELSSTESSGASTSNDPNATQATSEANASNEPVEFDVVAKPEEQSVAP